MTNTQDIISDILKRSNLSHLDMEIILAYILKKTREFVLTHPEYPVTKKQQQTIDKMIRRRIAGEPIAYLIGKKEFYGLDFFVNKNVLVPRPETELMIDEILQLEQADINNSAIIDIGTGSGCIIITLARLLNNYNLQFFAIDISKSALNIARKNAKLHNAKNKIKFLPGNLLDPILNKKIKITKLIILANLPYLTCAQIKSAPTIWHEPRLALAAGKDGLKYYRALFEQLQKIKDRYSAILIYCEIDPAQKSKILKILRTKMPSAKVTIKKDLKNHNRLVKITIKN